MYKQILNGKEFLTVRSADMGGIQVRRKADTNEIEFDGMPILFNTLSASFGEVFEGVELYERIAPHALDDVFASDPDVRVLIDHDSAKVLGRTKAKTAILTKSTDGVKMNVRSAATTYANDLALCMERSDIDGMSFGFIPDWDSIEYFEDSESGKMIRTINKIKELLEVSIVTFPQYPDTTASVARSLQDFDKIEKILKEKRQNNFASLGSVQRRLEVAKHKQKLWTI